MDSSVLWQRLDIPGHDAAWLRSDDHGAILEGCAVFGQATQATCARYQVLYDAAWCTRAARVEGFTGGRAFSHVIVRETEGWTLDGQTQPKLGTLGDLDFGFTPATNVAQLRRRALPIGNAVSFDVVWFDLGAPRGLLRLPQHYARKDAFSYDYRAPEYSAVLVMLPSGFVKRYPGLWRAEP
jgi:uncharacterized protein